MDRGKILNTGRRENIPCVEARYPVLVLTDQGPRKGETQLLNHYGAFIRCELPLLLNETATISIEISEREQLLTEVKAVWLEFNDLSQNKLMTPRGMVVRFVNLSYSDRQRLHQVIANRYWKKTNLMAGKG